MAKKLLALFGLKFNPFAAGVPTSALFRSSAVEEFAWRIEQQVGEGGFALVSGDPGTGKSAGLRILAERLANMRDVSVGVLTRPQASVADFYREMGHLFGVALSPHKEPRTNKQGNLCLPSRGDRSRSSSRRRVGVAADGLAPGPCP